MSNVRVIVADWRVFREWKGNAGDWRIIVHVTRSGEIDEAVMQWSTDMLFYRDVWAGILAWRATA